MLALKWFREETFPFGGKHTLVPPPPPPPRPKNNESYLSDQITFSNISGRTCQIYRLVLPLRAPETLSLLSK